MKKRILILTNTSGGLYLFRRELIQKLHRHHDIYVVTSDTGRTDELMSLGCNVDIVEIDRRGINPLKDLKYFLCILSKIFRIKPNNIITYTVKPNIYGGICARICHKEYVVNVTGLGTGFQSDKIRNILIKLYRIATKSAKAVFCENESIKEELIKYGICPENKIVVLSGAGVNLNHFSYIPYPDDEEIFNFLFVGRVMKEKGIDELIESINRLNSEGFNCKLTVVGGCEEDYKDILNNNINIDYKGQQLDVRPFIATAHCFVLPSYHEGMANTNLECAASGRPIITSNIPGCKEAVIENHSGYLCNPMDVDSLLLKMKLICKLDCEERKKMGIIGRKHMEEHFDKENVVNETIRYIF